jgi:NAD(P)-dependent dehydrogenase (short-subunit alcohol dehydrogenase family)
MTEQRLKDLIALITGASRGLGRAVALRYAQEGAHVLLLARGLASLGGVDDEIRAGGGKASLIPLDLADGGAVDALGPSLYEKFGRIDVLVGNAAILGGLSPLPHIPSERWERVLAVNLTANWRLIRTLDPLLRQAEAARVIFVTSSVAGSARAYWAPYSVSKAGLETLARTYANETAGTSIRVNLVDPGALATRMRMEAFPGEDQATLPKPEDSTDIFVQLATTESSGETFDASPSGH